MKKKLSLLLALLLIAITGAWADTAVLSTPSESVATLSDANGIVTIADGSGNTGIQQGSGSYKITYGETAYVPMKLSGSRNFTLSYKEGVTISKVTLLAMSNGDAEGTVGAGDGDATSLGTFPARNADGNCLTVDITGKTGLRGSRQFLALIVVEYSTTAPSLKATPDALTFALNPNLTTKTQTFTLTGQNLTNGEYALEVPNLAGLTVAPASFTVADGKVNQEISVTYASTEDVAKATTDITAKVGDMTASVAVTYQSRATAYTQSTISEAATWDWSKLSETVELTDASNPTKTEEFLLADLDDRINFTEAFGDAKAIVMKDMQFPSRAGYAQGITIKFKTSVAGTIAVDFSNTGGGDRPDRYLNVNGVNTEFKSNSTTTVNATGIAIPAGEVILKGNMVKADAEGGFEPNMLRWYKITFTPKAGGGEEPASNWKDIKADLTQLQDLATESNVYIKVAEDGSISKTENAEEANATLKGKWHGTAYGWSNFTASVPVEGCVKITYATHDYGNDIVVTNEAGAEVAKFNTKGAKWSSDPANVVVAYYRTNEPTTLHFSNANYNPYFAVEAIAPADLPAEVSKYNINFAAADDVKGVVPAAVEIEAGSKITAPKNYSLYKEGYTLIGWEAGNAVYLPGQEITPEADMTLTAKFGKNEVSLADRTAAVTIDYELSGYNDYPKHNFQSGDGLIVTQATVNGKTIDVATTTNGKFACNGTGWHQVNAGTKVTVPSCKGATISVKTYNDANALKFGDTAAEAGAAPATYTASAEDATLVIEQTANGYWNKLTINLPVEQSGGNEGATTLDNETATATFPFTLGTAGQKATFTNADYWISSKVELGSNNSYGGTLTVKDATMTLIAPETQLAEAGETGDIRFIIRPKFGYTFTPTKVSLKASKVGTDNSTLDIAWMNPDKTTASLAKAIKPERNNVNGYSALEYTDFSTAKPGEGACGLIVTLYGLQKGKQLGIADVVIEGTLSGTEKEVPILGSFKINGNEYKVEDVFGDDYEADLKLSKKEKMVSSDNPLADITPVSGELGQVTYEGTETSSKVTIPMTAGEVSLNYVLNITQKPDYTLTYFDVEGNELPNKQTIEEDSKIGEFIYDIADISSKQNGFKARGWFKQNYVGAKHSVDDVVTSDLKLYAVETEIEVASLSKKYEFDLTDINFDAADHEAFNPTGGKPNVSDMRHGWNFKENDKIELLVGPKANIIISTCQYPTGGTTKIVASNGQEVDAVSTNDGGTQAIEYEGEAGTLTLTISGGQCYIHKIVIFNTAETNYDQKGQWIYVKKGEASSFLDAIDAANGMSGTERVFIYVPNGTYDLRQKTLTTIGRNNISIIGESMEGTIIKNRPEKEGIGVTATLLNTANNTYLQDLTLDCIAPWDANAKAERGVCFQDKGNQTVMKNVYLKGLQDTYYSNNNSGTYYFEDCKIEGSVDYVCGNGDVYFNKTLFYTVNKSAAAGGAAGGVIAAPNTKKSFGYIFNECTLDGMANEDGKYRLGRPWASGTIVRMLNTTMLIKPTAAGWDEWSTDASKQNSVEQFAEYNSVDKDGNTVDLSQRKTSFKGVTNNPVITADEAANYTPEAIFNSTWTPATAAAQFDAPTDATLKDGTITWTAVEGAAGYAIFANDELLGITETTSYTITEAAGARRADGEVVYTIRTVNAMGGFGEALTVTDVTAISKVKADEKIDWNNQVVYDLQGRRVKNASKGVFIINGHKVIIK